MGSCYAELSAFVGDVTALAECDIQHGKGLAGYVYDVYGNPTLTAPVGGGSSVPTSVAAAIAATQPLRYAGYAYDSFSGLYYCSQRYYDPATCQFISADPVGADGEQSAYQYCGGDPVNHTDPTGLMMDFYDRRKAPAGPGAPAGPSPGFPAACVPSRGLSEESAPPQGGALGVSDVRRTILALAQS